MSEGYQRRDRDIVDYRLWRPPGIADPLRGPAPPSLEPGSYVACVGAAQTFGCLVERPWPSLLSAELGIPVLNLGVAGAGPRLFLAPAFRALIDGARLVVYQVMSGRSADCSRFASGGRERLTVRSDGRVLGADAAWRELLHADLAGLRDPFLRGVANRLRARFGRRLVRRLVQETRDDWVGSFRALLEATSAPSLLLWFSTRAPRLRSRYHSLEALFGAFPQLVDERMVRALTPHADAFVECVTSRGSPQPLRHRVTGAPCTIRPADADSGEDPELRWTHNAYYPSPEMHEDALRALLPAVRALLSS